MKQIVLFSISLLSLLLAGCATHTSETKDMRKYWTVGDTVRAEMEASEMAEEYRDSGDALVWKLEEGAVARGNGNLKKSVKSLEEAYSAVKAFEAESAIKLSEETSAFLTNQSYIPYKGYNYDKIMMSVYLAMNYMELKDFDNARVQLKRLEIYQQNAVATNRERIAKEETALRRSANEAVAKEKSKSKKSVPKQDIEGAMSIASKSEQFKKYYGESYKYKKGELAKSLYVNPFAYWISGVFFINKGEDLSDKQRAQDMFRIAGDLVGNNSLVLAQDYKMCEDMLSGKPVEKVTYVIYEAGCAPIRKQFKLNLPLFVFSSRLPHVSVNFPYLLCQNSYNVNIPIMAGGRAYTAETIVDMDNVIKEEFYNELPSIIIKTLISSAAKATIQYFASQALQSVGSEWALLFNIAGAIYQSAMNDADLRTWTTLPKLIQVARFATPQDGIVTVGGQQIKVVPNQVNVIIAKKMSTNGKLLLRKFDFSDTPIVSNSTDAMAGTAKN